MKTILSIIASFALATAAFGGTCGSCCPDGGKKDGKKETSVIQLGSGCGGCEGGKSDDKKEA